MLESKKGQVNQCEKASVLIVKPESPDLGDIGKIKLGVWGQYQNTGEWYIDDVEVDNLL